MATRTKHRTRSHRSHHNKPDFSTFIRNNNPYLRLFKPVKEK